MTNDIKDRRRSPPRRRVHRQAQIIFNRRTAVIDCTLHDVSTSGACLKVGSPIGIPDTFGLAIAGGQTRHCRVVWRKPDQIGVEFVTNGRRATRQAEEVGMITADQVKAARKLLGWSQMKLALEASVAQQTIVKFETAKVRPSVLSVSTIKRTLERAGVEFPEGEPVRLRTSSFVTKSAP